MNGFTYILTTLEISTKDIANKFGVSPSLISHMKRGDRNLTPKHEQILHSITGIPVYYYSRQLTRMDRFKIEEALLLNSSDLDRLNSLEEDYNTLLEDKSKLVLENNELKCTIERYKNRDAELLTLVTSLI